MPTIMMSAESRKIYLEEAERRGIKVRELMDEIALELKDLASWMVGKRKPKSPQQIPF